MAIREKLLYRIISVMLAVCFVSVSIIGNIQVTAADPFYSVYQSEKVSLTENSDGTLSVKPTGGDASLTFDPAFTAEANKNADLFPGTAIVIPEPMIYFSIVKKGDLTGYMALKWEGIKNYGWLMIRDMGGSNSDGINTKLRISFYNGSGEYVIRDYEYTYGAAVYAFVRYYNDVNRWSLAVEQPDGLFKVYQEDWHAMYITTSTNKTDRTPRRAMVSFSNACEGVKMKLAKASDISLDVDPDGLTPDKVNVTENDDGTYTLVAEGNNSVVVFNRAMLFNNAENGFVFNGTEKKIPASALEIVIKSPGDIKGWMGVKAEGAKTTKWLLFRDQGGNENKTTLRYSGYDGSSEYSTNDIEYTYGRHIYVWMRYGSDVNRWSFAVEQPDGTYNIYEKDIHAFDVGSSSYAAPKKLALVFSGKNSKVTAAAVLSDKLPGVKPVEKFNKMDAVEENGAYTLSHSNSAVFTFNEELTFEKTSLTYTAISQRISKNTLCITLRADSLASGAYLGIRLLEERDVESAILAAYTLRLSIASDNGDGTGVLNVSVYHGKGTPNGDQIKLNYRFGEPIYISPRYLTDVNRWEIATPNTNGLGYSYKSANLWHSDTPGVNSKSPYIPYRFSIISYNGVKNLTAAIVKAENVKQTELPEVPTDAAFNGYNQTYSNNEKGYYNLSIKGGGYARSTWKVDLTSGLIFQMADFSKDWITLAISGNYWSISDSNLGSASADYYTLLLRNLDGILYVALWNGSNEIAGAKLNGISALGSHILSVNKVTNDAAGVYYKLTIDGKTVVPGVSIMESSFNKINNYNEKTGKFDGAYFKFGCGSGNTAINNIRAFKTSEEKEIAGWITNTNANAAKGVGDAWNLNMESYSSIKLLKQAELAEGVTFSIDSLEERGQFGLAFSMLKNSSTLDIPPSLKNNNDLYFIFTDNGDSMVRIDSSRGDSAVINMNLNGTHTYSIAQFVNTDGKNIYTLAVDGQTVFYDGITYERFVQLNNGNLGAYLTLFSKNDLVISDFTGKLTTPATGNDSDRDWDGEDDEWHDDSDDWEDDDDWYYDWTDDDDTYDDSDNYEPSDEAGENVVYKKVLKKVVIPQEPIVEEYFYWWIVWVCLGAAAVAAGVTVFIVLRKRKLKNKK